MDRHSILDYAGSMHPPLCRTARNRTITDRRLLQMDQMGHVLDRSDIHHSDIHGMANDPLEYGRQNEADRMLLDQLYRLLRR